MSKIQVFDPPMCCPTDVCGAVMDPALLRFASDLDWLKENGFEVERFNLSDDPAVFVGNPLVAQAVGGKEDALPLVLVDGKVVARGSYPTREVLAELTEKYPAGRVTSGGVPKACCTPATAPASSTTLASSPDRCC